MSEFILDYQDGLTKILANGILFNDTNKPELSFSFDNLICESLTGLYYKILGSTSISLSESEINECKLFTENYLSNGNFPVYAYDPADNNYYKGYLQKSDCESNGYKWVLDNSPERLAASYNEDTKSWKYYYAVILDNGYVVENYTSIISNSVAIALTKDEFDNLPPKKAPTDIWDFKTESFIDGRDLSTEKNNAIRTLRGRFEELMWKTNTTYIPQYEQDTWRIQLDEANNYRLNSSYPTPYIDTFLKFRTGNVPSKDELVEDIINNNTNYIMKVAEYNAYKWNFMKKIDSATSCYEIDDIRIEFNEFINEKLK